MNDSKLPREKGALDRAISLAEAALDQCDEAGFIYAAIDISSAIDKLKALRADQTSE